MNRKRSRRRRATGQAPAPAPATAARPSGWRRAETFWWLVAPVTAVIAYRSIDESHFAADARFLIAENRYIRSLDYLWETLTHDYFWSSSGNVIPYWRPVTKVSWLLEYSFFGQWAGGYLLVQLAWHAIGVLGLQHVARQIGLSRPWALCAGMVFALHPVAIEPVAMLMARSDVVAAAGAVWAVGAWLSWRASGRLAWAIVHVMAVLVALGSKEQAMFLPALFAAWALLEGDGRSGMRLRLAQFVGPSAVLAVAYYLARKSLLEGVAEGLSATRLSIEPLRIFTGLGVYLWNSWPLGFSSSVRDVSVAEATDARSLAVAALVVSSAAVAVGVAVRKRDRTALALLGWFFLALTPVLLSAQIWVPTEAQKYSFADRWLMHALGPALLVWARWASAVPTTTLARTLQGAILGWAVLLLLDSVRPRSELATELGMLTNEDRVYYLSVPSQFRTKEDHCRLEQRRVARASLLGQVGALPPLVTNAIRVCGERPELLLELLRARVAVRDFQRSEPLARRLLEMPPGDPRSHADLTHLAGTVFLNTGHLDDAERWLLKSWSLGGTNCQTLMLLGETAERAGNALVASERMVAAYRCGGSSDPSMLVAAATWLVQAGEVQKARELVARLEGVRLAPDQLEQLGRLKHALASGEQLDAAAMPDRR